MKKLVKRISLNKGFDLNALNAAVAALDKEGYRKMCLLSIDDVTLSKRPSLLFEKQEELAKIKNRKGSAYEPINFVFEEGVE